MRLDCRSLGAQQIHKKAKSLQVEIWAGGALLFVFATPKIKHSHCFPLSFNARFCINHNVLLVVRVVGLLFALEIAILGSFWLWTGLALQTLTFWHNMTLAQHDFGTT